jgi:virginiamycin B lyase
MLRHAFVPILATMMALCGFQPMSVRASQTLSIVEYEIPTADSYPDAIISGPDGNVWFTESKGKLAKITSAGKITEFQVAAVGICAGPDGNVWFTEANAIGKITPAGSVTLFPYSGSAASSITRGADGNLYFTEYDGKIGKITQQGVITEYPLAADETPFAVTLGPDDNVWYATSSDATHGSIGKITPAGIITEYPLPYDQAAPVSIIAGPNDNLWYTRSGCFACSPHISGQTVGKITVDGVITEYSTPTYDSDPYSITTVSDGDLWAFESSKNQIVRIAVDGSMTEYAPFTANNRPSRIAGGPDGNLWFTDAGTNRIGKIVIVVAAAATVTQVPTTESISLILMGFCLITVAFYTKSFGRWRSEYST